MRRYARHWRVEIGGESDDWDFQLQHIPARGKGPAGRIRTMKVACGTKSRSPSAFQRDVPESTEDTSQVTCKRCLKYLP